MDERDLFVRLVRRRGIPGPPARRVDIQAPVAADGETDCWTYATRYAQATGARYIEGLCRRPDRPGAIAVHAWCEEDSPLGPVLVEFTPGYERATDYLGVQVVTDTPEFERACAPDGRRYSVLEFDLMVGASR